MVPKKKKTSFNFGGSKQPRISDGHYGGEWSTDESDWSDCADMLYPWSGRAGFESLKLGAGEIAPPRETMAAMLQYEQQLRLSDLVQRQLGSCYDQKDSAGLYRQKVLS